MEALKYVVEVIKWEESPWESYAASDLLNNFTLNGSGQTVFVGETKSIVRLNNKGIAPTPEILFEIVVEATREFAKTFKERTEHNPRIYHTIPKPLFKSLQGIIQDCLDKAYPEKKS